MIKFIDLFAGTGGIRIGFEQACKELNEESVCVLSSEIDPKARETYKLNFGEYPQGDIHEISNLPDFDFLLGGFPCQPFSYAGKQRGFGDTRGTLFFEVERILAEKKPYGFLLENVRGLTTHDRGRTFSTILQKLNDLGYGVSYLLLNSANFGVPQNRVRVYILGILNKQPKLTLRSDVGFPDSHKFKQQRALGLFGPTVEYKTVGDILEEEVDPKYNCSPDFVEKLKKVIGNQLDQLHGVRLIDYRNGNSIHSWEIGLKGKCTKEEIEVMNALIANRRKKIFGTHQDGKMLSFDQIKTFYKKPNLKKVLKSLTEKKYLKETDGKFNPVSGNMSFEVFKFLDPDSISITLVSSDAHKLGVVANGVARRLTPRECARIQGFPEKFKLHPEENAVYRQFGNAVSVPVVKEVVFDFLTNNFKSVKNNKKDQSVKKSPLLDKILLES